MNTRACPFVWSYAATNCSGGKVTYVGSYSFSYGNLLNCILGFDPAILKLTKSSKTHYVVVYSVNGLGNSANDYFIVDPWDGTSKSLTSYTNTGWSCSLIQKYN